MSLIYHYTNSTGLLGILQNQQLRATEINYLNDYEEYKSGINKLEEICKRKSESNLPLEPMKELYLRLHNRIRNHKDAKKTFITSFTDKADNLRQWMAYGSPNSSFAIGFDKEYLSSIHEKLEVQSDFNLSIFDECTYRLIDVDYDDNNIQKLIDENIMFEQFCDKNINIAEYILDIMDELNIQCCSTKNPEFVDESETRFVFQTKRRNTSKNLTKFREKSGILIPYIEIPFQIEAIKSITIGPNINIDMALAGLYDFVNHLGIDCEINKSNCTLRQI